MNTRRVLVTGGLGFIGSNLVNSLAEGDYEIDIVDDLSNGHVDFIDAPMRRLRNVPVAMLTQYQERMEIERAREEIVIFYGDFADEGMLRRISSGHYDIIFHLAANPRVEYSVKNPTETTEQNVLKTVALFEVAAKGSSRVIFASSSAIYGDIDNLPTNEAVTVQPNSPYALQKFVGEEFARLFAGLYDLDVVSLRFFNVYGPNQYGSSPYSTAISAWCDKVSGGNTLRSDGDGTQTRDMVYVSDIVSACILAGESVTPFKGDVYNIATGKSYSNNQILEAFNARFTDLVIEHAPPRPGDVMHTLADISRASQELGYAPQIDLAEGLSLTWNWWELGSEEP